MRLSERYLPDRYLPDKAIDLMDEAAARVRIRGRQEPPELRRMEEEHHAAETALRQAVEQEQFEQAAALRDQEQTLLNRWQREKRRWSRAEEVQQLRVEPSDVSAVLSVWTGIPAGELTADESRRLIALEEKLHRRVVGQSAGVAALARSLRRSRAGLQEEGRPVGAFLFAGPSGVGKTELSRALAEALFGVSAP